MSEHTKFIGLDVHAETIAVAVATKGRGVAEFFGTIPATESAVAALVRKLGPLHQLHVGYEAGPCGYGLYRQLTALGVTCTVVAPSLIPVAPGDRVKTDRRDARKLAQLLRAGVLTAVRVPDEASEALRDLTRARQAAQQEVVRTRNRLGKLLLRLGLRPPDGVRRGSAAERDWMVGVTLPNVSQQLVLSEYRVQLAAARERVERLEAAIVAEAGRGPLAPMIAALETLRGVDVLTATTLVVEFGDPSRFTHAREAMAYTGLVPTEHSSGGRQRRGGITSTGNAHLRWVLVEAAWHYQHAPALQGRLKARQDGQPEAVRQQAWAAQQRLYRRYHRLLQRGKPKGQVVVAVARELVGFVWGIAHTVRRLEARTSSDAGLAA
jgi:transposase